MRKETKRMKEEDFVLEKMSEAEQIMLDTICNILRGYENKIQYWLAYFVSALCNVEMDKMLTDCNTLSVAQARWLFWYSYRRMTNETYEKIAKVSSQYYGKYFTTATIANGITKMTQMIECEPIWTKRWVIIKRVIKQYQESLMENEEPIKIVIPKNAKVELKRK